MTATERPELEPLNEFDELLIPTAGGTRTAYPVVALARRLWRAASGFGMAPLHFITQRGPFQDGSTPLGMRFDERVVQIVAADFQCSRSNYWDRRDVLLDLLRPNRSFGSGSVMPLVYRKSLPAGKVQRGCDLVTTNGSAEVTSALGRFVGRGLEIGHPFTITTGADAGAFTITSVPNDYTLTLSAALGATAADVCWSYPRGWGKRDLFCLLELGPSFSEGPGPLAFAPTGFNEVLRFVAHDPLWYGQEQTETWALPDDIGDLVFDGLGAWFGVSHGAGRWLFAPSSVSETVAIIYWGTRFAKPVIYIDGPAENPLIRNTTIGVTLQMDYTVALGETVVIDTLAQTVKNNADTNLMPYLEGDLARFGLFPRPQAPGRQNEVYVSFSSATTDSAARLAWQNRYIGI